MSVTFSSGIIVLVESDDKNEWWLAKDWQAQEFIKSYGIWNYEINVLSKPFSS